MRAAAEQGSSRIRRSSPGTYWTPDLGQLRVAAGHRPGARTVQDCQSVRIYAFEQCPRQDSNLRSRLRRPMLYDAPTWQDAPFPSGWGAYGERPGTNPCCTQPHGGRLGRFSPIRHLRHMSDRRPALEVTILSATCKLVTVRSRAHARETRRVGRTRVLTGRISEVPATARVMRCWLQRLVPSMRRRRCWPPLQRCRSWVSASLGGATAAGLLCSGRCTTTRSLMRGLSSGSAAAGRLVGDADRAEDFTSCGVRGVLSLRVMAIGWGTRLRKHETEGEQR
jgi:hypothetical protein